MLNMALLAYTLNRSLLLITDNVWLKSFHAYSIQIDSFHDYALCFVKCGPHSSGRLAIEGQTASLTVTATMSVLKCTVRTHSDVTP